MGIIRSVILDEYDRNLRMQQAYLRELEQLPKGSISPKMINGRVYYYWMYREDGKVFNKYISAKDNDIKSLKELVQKRRHLEKLIKNLKREMADMERYLKVSKNGE